MAQHPLPYAFAREHNLLAAARRRRAPVLVAAAGRDAARPGNTAPWAKCCASTGRFVASAKTPAPGPAHQRRLRQPGDASAAAVVSEVESDADLSRMMQELPAIEDLLETADDAPIIRMLNALLTQAARDGASDIHIEPYERHSSVRFRVDGTLREVVQPNRALHAALISRLKIMAELDIAEKRLPQDGRISLRWAPAPSTCACPPCPAPTASARCCACSTSPKASSTWKPWACRASAAARFEQLIGQPHGIILVTGPTGSGKTTTLYAALQRLDAAAQNIMTVEDPIEYELPGIGQTQVNAKIELTFAKALRAILRQDPDVIMIGEIRDHETAQIAIQASLTGHLVLATLHTNDAASAVTRLTDMGIEPFLLSQLAAGRAGPAPGAQAVPALPWANGPNGERHPVGCTHCTTRLPGPHRHFRAAGDHGPTPAQIRPRAS
jgi:general secretion pathway protein E